ncbi:sialidase family protein [Verrucomicrobiota bacterium]
MQQINIYRNEHSFCGPISMLQKLPNGEILLVFREALWKGIVNHTDPTTRTSLIRSSDNGKSWHSMVTPDPSGGNGTTITALSNGTMIVSNYHWIFTDKSQGKNIRKLPEYREVPKEIWRMDGALDGIYTCRSQTDGYTWEAPRKVISDALFSMTTAGRIVEMPDGCLLLPVNAKFKTDDNASFSVMRSEDHGESWNTPCAHAGYLQGTAFFETRMVLLNDSTLVAMHRTKSGNFYMSSSADAGTTWNQPVETPIWCGGSSPADLLVLNDGRLLCTYGHRRPPYGVRACISDDGGNHWDTDHEIILRDDGIDKDMGYPSSLQLDKNTILTVYYWHGKEQIRYLEGTVWAAD